MTLGRLFILLPRWWLLSVTAAIAGFSARQSNFLNLIRFFLEVVNSCCDEVLAKRRWAPSFKNSSVNKATEFWIDCPEASLARFVFSPRNLLETFVERKVVAYGVLENNENRLF